LGRLLDINVLDLLPSGQLSGVMDSLADSPVDPAADAELVAQLLPEVAAAVTVTVLAVVEPGRRAHDVDRTSVASLLRGESDGGRGSLDALGLLVLGVKTDTDKLGSSDMADIVLRNLFVVHQLNLRGNVELDGNVALRDVVGVRDLDITAVQRVVKSDMGVPMGERKSELGASSALERNADDGVVLHHAVHLVLDSEEAANAEEEEGDHEELDEAPGAVPPLLPSLVGRPGASATTMAEPTPKALAPADSELLGLLIDAVDRKARINWLLDVDWVLRHEWGGGGHGAGDKVD